MARFVFCALGLLLCAVQNSQQADCDLTGIEIKGGTHTLSEGNKGTKKLQYKCPEGMYPYPVQGRTCNTSGKWSLMKSSDGKTVEKAICKAVRCPSPVDFEHGSYYPKLPFYPVESILQFECYEGYKLSNSDTRTCLPNGKWSGETAICDDGSSDCPNPGQPIGSVKNGNQYRIEDKVTYKCRKELSMYGSKERVCLEDKTWSGTEPSCRQPYTFDTPEEVAASFIGSLAAGIEVADSDKVGPATKQRKFKIEEGGNMNIYIILDASDSVGGDPFEKAKSCIMDLIEKISSYDITPRYVIVTYATEPKILVDLEEEDSTKADRVIDRLETFDYSEHDSKSGTNTRAAIEKIYNMMTLHKQRNNDTFKDIRHVMVLMTDGKANMGGDPKIPVTRIRNFLEVGVTHEDPREDYLDIYVFGLGEDVNDEEMNSLASKKDGEKHIFKLEDIKDLQETFDEIIDESSAMGMCGMAKEFEDSADQKKDLNNPWIATISITRQSGVESCKGSIVASHYILTAAHCFTVEDEAHNIYVYTNGNDRRRYTVKKVISHPQYNINGKKPKIGEFYDYDIALVDIIQKIDFKATVRPICIPCTQGTTRALRKPLHPATCHDHEATLLKHGNVDAMFISEENGVKTRKTVRIKNGDQKAVCNKDALKASIYENVTDVGEVVTDRFLCTGGTEPQIDEYTCKGDSGGPLLINFRKRYIQVGVISWGVLDQCSKLVRKGQTKPHSRDFHTNLFKVYPWLKERLDGEGLDFLKLP